MTLSVLEKIRCVSYIIDTFKVQLMCLTSTILEHNRSQQPFACFQTFVHV